MARQSTAARVSDDDERPSLYVVSSERAPVPADVLATLRVVAEIMLAKRRREQREAKAQPGTDVVESVTNREGRDRASGRDPKSQP